MNEKGTWRPRLFLLPLAGTDYYTIACAEHGAGEDVEDHAAPQLWRSATYR